jgi:hypothetical protein
MRGGGNSMRKQQVTHVILGVCMQTGRMAEILGEAGATKIAVIDYEAEEDHIQMAEVHFYSPRAAERRLRRSRQIVFHKYLTRKR